MKTIKEGKMPNGVAIQIEDWSEIYSFYPEASTLAAYPTSKKSHPGAYSPKGNEMFRADFNFPSAEETVLAFEQLVAGDKTLSDFVPQMTRKEYADCL